MAKVYYSADFDRILERIDFSKLGENVAIKVHFGETGCTTYLSSLLVKKVYDKVVSLRKFATLVECNVLYRGSRTNATEHIKTAKSHGFDFAPIDILDGELGNEEINVKIDEGLIKNAKIGAGIKKYDSMIVLTHFKGHMMAGYGGAMKNIGMGLASRAGKLAMHSNLKPSVRKEKCTGCLTCVENCDSNAIDIIEGKADISKEKCIGCAMCIVTCPTEAMGVPWQGGTSEELQKKIVEYSKAVIKIIPNIFYINFLINITKDCDCMNISQKPIIEDIGFLFSDDIVAIDKVSLDLVNSKSNCEFDRINKVDKSVQVEYAYEKNLGEKDYNLIDLDC